MSIFLDYSCSETKLEVNEAVSTAVNEVELVAECENR